MNPRTMLRRADTRTRIYWAVIGLLLVACVVLSRPCDRALPCDAPAEAPRNVSILGREEPKPATADRAFVTIFNNQKNQQKYRTGLLVLAWSLVSSGTRFPLLVMCTEDVERVVRPSFSHQELRLLEAALGVRFVQIGEFEASDFVRPSVGNNPSYLIALNKLEAWKLMNISRGVFLDLDSVVVRNMDFLLDFPEFTFAYDICSGNRGLVYKGLNAGLFTFRPAPAQYRKFVQFARDSAHPKRSFLRWSEQGIFAALLDGKKNGDPRRWTGLPFTFGVSPVSDLSMDSFGVTWDFDTLHWIHFYCVAKPWDYEAPAGFSGRTPPPNDAPEKTKRRWFYHFWHQNRMEMERALSGAQ